MVGDKKIKKEVLFFSLTDSLTGGPAANTSVNIVKGLYENNVNVHFFLVQSNKSSLKRTGVYDGIHYKFINPCSKPNSFLQKIIQFILIIFLPIYYIFKYHKRKKQKIAVFLYGFEYAYYTFPILVLRLFYKFKVIRFVTDLYSKESIVKNYFYNIKYFFYRIQLNLIDRKFDYLVVFSNYLRDFFIRKKTKQNKLIIVNQFINTKPKINKFDFSFNDIFRKVKTIGYVGTISEFNGVLILFDAFVKLKQTYKEKCILFYVGDINYDKDAYKRLVQKIKQNNLENNVVFTGFVESKYIPYLLKQFDVLVSPRGFSASAQAGFPTKLGEYFISKTPTVFTKNNNIEFILRDNYHTLFAQPSNSTSLAEKIEILLSDMKLAERISNNAYQWVKSNLDYKISVQKILRHINQ